MAILNHGSTLRTADGGQTTTTIVTAANIGTYGVATNSTYYVGTTQNIFNRASGAQTLTGVSIDGNAATVSYPFNNNNALDLNSTGTTNQFSAFNVYYPSGGSYNQPIGGSQHFKILQFGRYNADDVNYWRGQMAMSFYTDRMFFRKEYLSTWGSWMEFLHTGNYAGYSAFTASLTSTVDARAPIFYDSNDTAYYVDPNSNSILFDVEARGGINLRRDLREATGISFYNTSYYNWQVYMAPAASTGCGANGNLTAPSGLTNVTSWALRSRMETASTYGWLWEIGGSGGGVATATSVMELDTGGILTLSGQVRAPIFYDRDNTAYYIDAASTSNLVGLTVVNTITGSVSGNAGTATVLQTARNINGTSFNGSAAITTASWGTARTLTIGSTGKSVDGSAAVSWSLAEIGAAATNQTMFIGTTSVAINRASASQTLTGISIDGNAATATNGLTTSNYVGYSAFTGSVSSGGNITATSYIYTSTYLQTGGNLIYPSGYGATQRLEVSNAANNTWIDGITIAPGGIVTAPYEMRSPIFYDSNDTTYYIDPASTSRVVALWVRGSSETTGNIYIGGTSAGNRLNINYDQIWTSTGHLYLQYSGAGNIDMNTGGGHAFSRTSLRAPIFYDFDNTAYYCDPASTSVLNRLTIDGGNYANNYFQSLSDFVNGTLVTTDIPATAANGLSFVMNVVGKSYNTATSPFDFNVQGYLYNSTIINYSGMSLDSTGLSTIKVFENGGFLCFWWARVSYWNAFEVSVRSYDAAKTNYNRVTNITDVVEPTGTKKVTVTLHRFMRADASATNSVDLRAPIFYDSNDTAYYTDPSSLSNILELKTNKNWYDSSASAWGGGINMGGNNPSIGFQSTSSTWWYMLHHSSSAINFYRRSTSGSWNHDGIWDSSGNFIWQGSSVRASIFYDNNDTAYYINPNSTSNLYDLTVANNLTVNGNTYLGNAGGDTVFVNDIIRIGATDSGDASLFFGEGSVAGSDYGARWYWDSGYTFTWYTRNAGTDTSLFDYVTNDTTYLNWRRNFHMQNKEINYNAQIHFNAGTRFVGQDTNYLVFRSDSTSVGGIRVQDGGIATKGYIGYWDSGGGGILNNTGNWAVRYNFGSSSSGGTLYGSWISDTDFRAPIFYDSNDTTYYLDPNSLSNIRHTIFHVGSNVVGATGVGVLFDGNYTSGQYRHRFRKYDDGGGLPLYIDYASATANSFTAIARFGGGGSYNPFSVYGTADASGDFRAPIFYDSANTAYYVDPAGTSNLNALVLSGASYFRPQTWIQMDGSYGMYWPNTNGCHIEGNTLSTYGSLAIRGTRGGWKGIHFYEGGNVPHLMFDGSANGGVYFETGGRWASYYSYSNNCWGFATSTTNSAYNLYVPTGVYSGGRVDGTIFYDSNNTAYYLDPANTGTSLLVAGKVGIGTTSPTYKLQIGTVGSLDDSIRIGTYQVAKNTRQYIGYTRHDSGLFESAGSGDTPSTVLGGVAGIRIVNTEGTLYAPQADNSVQLLTHIYNGGSQVALHANYNGNVGIGTTTPAYKLDVNGTGRFSGDLTVTNILGSSNSATLYPNTGSYGSWKIGGTRNGWYGIEFESSSNLMMNSNEVGFHRNGHGWQLYWSAGTAYCLKGNPGGGTQATILDSSNQSYAWAMNQSVTTGSSPTFVTVTGTAINIAGNGAGYDTYGTIGVTEPANASNYSYYGLTRQSNIGAGFGLTGTTGALGLGANAFWFGGATSTAAGVMSTAYIAFNGSNLVAVGTADATQFRDKDNTAYYVDAASTSNLTGLTVANTITGSISGNSGTVGGLSVHSGRNNEANKVVRTDSNGYIQAGWINTDSGDSGFGTRLTRITCSTDNYLRYLGLIDFKVSIGGSGKNDYSRRVDQTSDVNYHVGSFGHSGYGANETFHGGSGFFDIWSGTNYPSGLSHVHGFNALHYTVNSLGTTGGNAYGWQMAAQYNSDSGPWWRRCSGGSFSSWLRLVSYGNNQSGTIYASDFYDNDNTAYYINAASTSNLAGLTVVNTITGSITGNAGGSSASCTGNSATTTLATKATRANGNFYIDDNYGNTVVGAYSASRYQGVYAMGDSYKLAADGSTTGSLYGIAWSHPNAGGAAGNLSNHGALILINGGYAAAISSSIRCTVDMRTPIYYDSDNTAYYIDAGSTSYLYVLSVASAATAADYYTAGWFRSSTSGNGMYNQVTTQHFYSDSINYWNVASSASTQGIRFRTGGHAGTVRGYIIADTNNDVGLLNQDGNWRVRVVSGDYTIFDGSSIRAQIFYDSNDTGYYTDPAGTSILNVVRANSYVQKSASQSLSGTVGCTIDVAAAGIHVLTLAASTTISSFTYNYRAPNPSVNTIMLVIKYGGTASITWTNVLWANGVTPTITGVSGYADVYMLTSYQGTTGVWIGTVVSQGVVSTSL